MQTSVLSANAKDDDNDDESEYDTITKMIAILSMKKFSVVIGSPCVICHVISTRSRGCPIAGI